MKSKQKDESLLIKALLLVLFSIIVFLFVTNGLASTIKSVKSYLTGKTDWLSYTTWTQPNALFTDIETQNIRAFSYRGDAIEAFSSTMLALGEKQMRNFSYIKDAEGFLHAGNFYRQMNPDIMFYAKQVRDFKVYAQEKGVPLLFICGVDRYLHTKELIPAGYPVDRIAFLHMDEMMLDLYALGVDTYDMTRSEIEEWRESDLFYKTEDTIKTEASFEVFEILVEEVKAKYNVDLDPTGFYTDIGNYKIKVYDDMIGKLGSSAGIAFGGLEKFLLISPAFETVFTVKRGSDKIVAGDFEKTILDFSEIAFESPRDKNYGDIYFGKAERKTYIKNYENTTGPKVLVICDDEFLPVCAFLANATSELSIIVPSAYSEHINVERYFDEADFDVVIMAFDPKNIVARNFNFYDKQWLSRYNQMQRAEA